MPASAHVERGLVVFDQALRGDVDETLLEALEDYVKRQKKRLKTNEAAN